MNVIDFTLIFLFVCGPEKGVGGAGGGGCACLCVYNSLCVQVCFFCDLYCGCICLVFLCPRFSKKIRVMHCYYLPKNPYEREEHLLGILSLESQTSFSCNQKSQVGSLSSSLL